MPTNARFIYITTGSNEEADRIGAALIDERLAACANVIPGMRSLYHWQGKVEMDEEIVLILKTRADLVEAVTDRVRALHSYDCPCVVALPVEGGNPEFIEWIETETRK